MNFAAIATKVAAARPAARGTAQWRGGGKASVGGWRCQLAFGGVFGGDRVGRF